MVKQTTRLNLINAINNLRNYGQRLLEGLSTEELLWVPKESKGRSITSIFRHIIEGEIHWLDHIGHTVPEDLDKLTSFTELMDLYLSLQSLLTKLVNQSTDTDLVPKTPEEGATLAFVLWHTSFHAIHHFAQIGYLRHAIDNPPESKAVNTSWDYTMDSLISLGYK